MRGEQQLFTACGRRDVFGGRGKEDFGIATRRGNRCHVRGDSGLIRVVGAKEDLGAVVCLKSTEYIAFQRPPLDAVL